jgi:hypothetical protein
MSKPDQQHVRGTEEVAEDAPFPQGAENSRGEDSAVSVAAQSTRLAEASLPQPAVASGRHLAFGMLRSTVEEMVARGATTFAAGVAARIKQNDPDFSVRDLGFSSFKAFLQAASDEAFVIVTRPTGASDVFVSLPSTDANALTPSPEATRYLRSDIWRALTSPRSEALFWDTTKSRLTGERQVGAESATAELKPIPTDEIVGWMTAFVRALSESEVSAALADALTSSRPVDSFKSVVRSNQGIARKWGKFYREHVVRHALSWAEANDIQRAQIVDGPRPGPVAAPTGGSEVVPAKAASTSADLTVGSDYEALVRSKVADAIQRMPLPDLLRLPVPAQYLIDG